MIRNDTPAQQPWQETLRQAQGKNSAEFLVLHGGSGTPEEDIKEAIRLGVVKININTELRLAFAGNLRRVLDAEKQEVVPYKFLAEAKGSVERVVERKIKLFDSGNKIY